MEGIWKVGIGLVGGYWLISALRSTVMSFCVKNRFEPWNFVTGFISDMSFDELHEKEWWKKVLVGRKDVGSLGFVGLVNGDIRRASGVCCMASTKLEPMILGSNSISWSR